METVVNFILTTVISFGFVAGFFLIVGLIFSNKSTKEFLSEYFDWIRAIPGGLLFIFGWGIFVMIPIMLVICLLDLIVMNSIFRGIGSFTRILFILLGLFLLSLWYGLGFRRLPKDKHDDNDI